MKGRLGDGAPDMVVEGALDDIDPYLPMVCRRRVRHLPHPCLVLRVRPINRGISRNTGCVKLVRAPGRGGGAAVRRGSAFLCIAPFQDQVGLVWPVGAEQRRLELHPQPVLLRTARTCMSHGTHDETVLLAAVGLQARRQRQSET